ncbi:hypothetical protein C8J56DRAFT_1139750 [Mycena floridula]|nr:hypothetical protein C8J56DRAFT_1139750 [Mycena floridula]
MSGYCQIGGFNHDDFETRNLLSELCRNNCVLAGEDGCIDFVFGIRKSGASCWLLTEEQVRRLPRNCGRIHYSGRDFVSLSPAGLPGSRLQEILDEYKPARNKKRENWDNSRNNKAFCVDFRGEPDEPSEAAKNRALFEQARLFQHILKHPNADRYAFGVTRTVDFSKIRLCAFTATCWNADHSRSWETRQAYPLETVIDVGSAEGNVSRHLVRVKNQTLSQRGLTKADFAHGETEHLKEEDFLRAFGSFFRVGNSEGIWRRRVGDGALRSSFLCEALAWGDLHIPLIDLRIMNTRGPQLVLVANDLLPITTPILANPAPMIAKEPEPMTEVFHQEAILLVTIPPRINAREALLILDALARLDETIHTEIPGLGLLDAVPTILCPRTSMTASLIQTKPTCLRMNVSIGEMSDYLGFSVEDKKLWCAGNEAVRLLRLFTKMSEGDPIDLQKGLGPQRMPVLTATFDEEQDPNDYVPETSFGGGTNLDDEVSDYGGSDSDE